MVHLAMNRLRHGWGLVGLVVVMLGVTMPIVLLAPERVAVPLGWSFLAAGTVAMAVSQIVKASRRDRK